MALTFGNLGHLLPPTYKRLITSWLEEDCPSFDCGGFVVGDSQGEARLLGKSKVRFTLFLKNATMYTAVL
jgi:nicotinate-nucleotide pyrophosphorylase (carboxylating)